MDRRSRVAGILTVVAIVATACSSGSNSPASSGAASSAASSAGASVTATSAPSSPAAAPGSAGGSGAPSATGSASGSGAVGGGELAGQTVTVIGTWTGDDENAFRAMVAPWEQQTGGMLNYTGTRDLNAVLTTGIASNVLPDLAGLPGPEQMARWKDNLIDLRTVLDMPTYTSETSPALVAHGIVDNKLVGVFMKAAVQGLIWFDPKVEDLSKAPPKTWDGLQKAIADNTSKATASWCLGVEAGPASGWPGTDWIEDIVLRQSGPNVYEKWYQGKLRWTDPAIAPAWTTFGDVVANSFGGAATITSTNFANAGDPLLASPRGCLLFHGSSVITGLGAFKNAKPGTDYDFFPFPDVTTRYAGAVVGGGDLFGMFHDTPAAKSLMAYLVTAPAQDIWVRIGGALSANKNATDYPDDISKRSAAILTNAKIFAFDASDLMPAAMNDAFQKAIVAYIKNPRSLDSILANLDTTQGAAYPTQ